MEFRKMLMITHTFVTVDEQYWYIIIYLSPYFIQNTLVFPNVFLFFYILATLHLLVILLRFLLSVMILDLWLLEFWLSSPTCKVCTYTVCVSFFF